MSIAIADLAKSLDRLIRGDLGSLGAIVSAEHTEVLKAAEALGTPLMIPRTAAISVVRGLIDGAYAPEMAQAWLRIALPARFGRSLSISRKHSRTQSRPRCRDWMKSATSLTARSQPTRP